MADIDAFLEDIVRVCRTHGLCISHEDTGGAFVIGPFNETAIAWLRAAMVHENTAQSTDPAIEAAIPHIVDYIDGE